MPLMIHPSVSNKHLWVTRVVRRESQPAPIARGTRGWPSSPSRSADRLLIHGSASCGWCELIRCGVDYPLGAKAARVIDVRHAEGPRRCYPSRRSY